MTQSGTPSEKHAATQPLRYPMMKILMANEPIPPDAFAQILTAHHQFIQSGGGGGHWVTVCTSSDDPATGLVLGIYTDQPSGGKDGKQADLSHQRLDGLDLVGVSLPYANLCGVSCAGQDLSGAVLIGSLLVDSDFTGSSFWGAHLIGADLSRCDLCRCDLRDADLTGADLEYADLTGADLRGAITRNVRLDSAVLDQVVGLERQGPPPKPTRARRKSASRTKKPPAAGDANRQLLAAASKGDLAAVEAALQQGAAVDTRDEHGDTALNQAAEWGHLEVVRRLLEAGSDVENRGGADKTPLMNAALDGHGEVAQLLVENGARITDDLLSSLQLKVKILEENAEEGMVLPEGVQAWKAFLDLLGTERLRQDLPELVRQLSSTDAAVRTSALDRVETAGYRGLDISAALPQLRGLVGDPDDQVRQTAAAALCTQLVRSGEWDAVGALCKAGDGAVKGGVISVVVASARAKYEILPFVPTLLELLVDPKANLRSDAAIALGYAATNGADVASAVPNLAARLSDAEADVRKMAAWALYRIARYVGSIAAAVPTLRALSADADEGVRDIASEALRAEEGRVGA